MTNLPFCESSLRTKHEPVYIEDSIPLVLVFGAIMLFAIAFGK